MTPEDHVQKHLELCKRMYLRMLQDDTFPWDALQDDAEAPSEGPDTSDTA